MTAGLLQKIRRQKDFEAEKSGKRRAGQVGQQGRAVTKAKAEVVVEDENEDEEEEEDY